MSVQENEMEFNGIEREIFRKCCIAGCAKIKEYLERRDNWIMVTRDSKKYRNKGQRKTTIKTIMGEVEYERNLYIYTDENGAKRSVFLLDEAMGIGGAGAMSGLLCGLIVGAACNGTYRDAAQSVSEMTGQSISHTAAWEVVQALGKQVETEAQEAARRAERSEGRGRAETEVLFVEKDGIWLHLQGKARTKDEKSKEMKVAIAYDGSEKEGTNRYRLTGKVAAATFDSAEQFGELMEGAIAEEYNVDEIKLRVVNGDGAAWIKQGVDDATVVYQLDPYHRNKAVTKNVDDKSTQKKIFQLLSSKQIDKLLEYIDVSANSTEDEAKQKKLRALWGYFDKNKEGLVDWKERGLEAPEAPEGKEYRGLGAMESNVFTIIGNRMKGGRACWSIDGANNLARLLALKYTGKLRSALSGLVSRVLPQKYAEDVNVNMSAAQAPDHDGKGYEMHRAGAAPATPTYKFMRDIARGGSVFEQG
jgi:hypothetical protein